MNNPDPNTSTGQNRRCLQCWKCRTQTFRSLQNLEDWITMKEVYGRKNWEEAVKDVGEITLYWCANHIGRPRRYRKNDPNFTSDFECFIG